MDDQPGIADPGIADPGTAGPGMVGPGTAGPGMGSPGMGSPGMGSPGIADRGTAGQVPAYPLGELRCAGRGVGGLPEPEPRREVAAHLPAQGVEKSLLTVS